MTQLYFSRHSYRSQSADIAEERLINAYLETEPQGAKGQTPVIGAPGIAAFSTVGVGPLYGAHVMNGILYVVSGTELYSINSAGTETLIGTVEGYQRVSMSDNGTQLVIVNGLYHYVYTVAGGLSKIALGLDSDYSISVTGAGPSSTEVTITLTGGPSTGANVNQVYVSLTADGGAAVVFSELPGNGDTISDVATALAATIDAHAAFAATAVAGVITVTPDGGTTNLTAASGTAAIYQWTLTVGSTFATNDVVRVDVSITGQTEKHFVHEVTSSDTAATIATALQTVIDADSLLTATVSSNVVTVHATEQEVTAADSSQDWLVRGGASPMAKQVWALDGYFIFPSTTTQSFSLSNLNDGATILGTGSVTTAAGNIVSACVNQRQLVLLCENFGEVWRNTGNADFPFERIPGAHIERGSAATYSIGKDDNSFAWLGDDRIVYGMAAGSYSPTRISTHGVEHQLNTYATIDDAFAFVISWKGHKFYVLTFPTEGATWIYDVATREWHERRSYYNNTSDVLGGNSATAAARNVLEDGTPITSHIDCHFDVLDWSPSLGIFGAGGVFTEADSSSGAAVMRSHDGYTWLHDHLAVDANTPLDFQDILWVEALAIWIGVDNLGGIFYSSDLLTWTASTTVPATSSSWRALSYSSDLGKIIAFDSNTTPGGGNIQVITSTDGDTWTLETTLTAGGYSTNRIDGSVWCSALTLWVAVGRRTSAAAGRIITSPDAATWTFRSAPAAITYYNSVEWAPELDMIVAAGNRGIASSPDGVTWTLRHDTSTINWNGVKWSGALNRFGAIGENAGLFEGYAASSPDGVTWTSRTISGGGDSVSWLDLAYSPQLVRWVATARNLQPDTPFIATMSSDDAISWNLDIQLTVP